MSDWSGTEQGANLLNAWYTWQFTYEIWLPYYWDALDAITNQEIDWSF